MNHPTRVSVRPETRNHRGCFVNDETFFLVEETSSGWARICVDQGGDGYDRCHLVNPEDLEILKRQGVID